MKHRDILYFDNAATTRTSGEVVEAMGDWLGQRLGNPSSRHPFGVEAADAIDTARRRIARATDARAEDVQFTSGGTESNNLAVLGGATVEGRRSGHVLIGPTEHPSVRRPAEHLAKLGFALDVAQLAPDGTLDLEDFESKLRPDTMLVSVMVVSNEFGTVYPVREIAAMTRRRSPRATIHTDAVQAFGKLELSLDELGVDALSISGHKFHGPMGTGALVHRPGLRLQAQLHGGGQEHGLRSGTQNVAGIVGLGLAAELAEDQREEHVARLSTLRETLRQALLAAPGIEPLEPGGTFSPTILAARVEGPPAEVWMHHLERLGIFVSTGSACHSKSKDVSPAYASLGLDAEAARRVLRISISGETSAEDVEQFVRGLESVCSELQTTRV